jgi:hypothetical protein
VATQSHHIQTTAGSIDKIAKKQKQKQKKTLTF